MLTVRISELLLRTLFDFHKKNATQSLLPRVMRLMFELPGIRNCKKDSKPFIRSPKPLLYVVWPLGTPRDCFSLFYYAVSQIDF